VQADLLAEFRWRGLIYDATEGISDLLASGPVTAYVGIDPTASSLHVGNLMPVMALARLQRSGHKPLALIGGGTGMIGDPSGRSQERNLLSRAQIVENVAGVEAQLERFLDFRSASHPARLVNNADWLSTVDLLTFLRDVGKHFTVNYMLQKESVSRRLEGDEGISYTEFSYLMLQAYDFLHLFDQYGCTLQLGGSDQWGNITAGLDLIRRLRSKKAHGLVWPLITSPSGVKFGKTEAGAVWLDPARTSPYEFYQFWFNTDDRDVIPYLKFFTFLDAPSIGALEAELRQAPEERAAQRALARIVTTMVHGEGEVANAEQSASAMFSGDVRKLPVDDFLRVFGNVPSTSLPAREIDAGVALTELLAAAGLAKSKSDGTRLIRGGGIYLNGDRIHDERHQVTRADALHGRFLVLRKGAKLQHLVRIER
jgi:tyrosyl-tRNA synthetase